VTLCTAHLRGVDALVAELDAVGDLPPSVESVLCRVPREWFVPDRAWVHDGQRYQPIDRVTDPDAWLAAVYRNAPIVTQFDDGLVCWPQVGDRPTCSASMPSVVVSMLSALDVRPGQSVLEIGTGTGFNAALLAELVGPTGCVTTVELDPQLHEEGRSRLAAAGYPQVRCVYGDGTAAVAGPATFDRVIATASAQLGRIPYSWVAQTRPGGLIVTPVRADLASGPLVCFEVTAHGTAIGRTAPMSVGFMELRQHRTPRAPEANPPWRADPGEPSISALDPAAALFDPAARWALAVAMPSCRYDIHDTPADGAIDGTAELAWLCDPISESWATIAVGADQRGFQVRQAGPRRLWDEAHAAYAWWQHTGEPDVEAWEWIITPDRQSIAPVRPL
jgi:protein-L-isoaspartate O-methyltransferase